MRINELSDTEILKIRNLFSLSSYILLKEESTKVMMPILRPKVSHSGSFLIIVDELGYEATYNELYEIFVCDSCLMINSLDYTVFKTYMLFMNLGEIEQQYNDAIKKRIIKSVFTEKIDMSEFVEKPLSFIEELFQNFNQLKITTEICNSKKFEINIKSTKVNLSFNIWNLDEYILNANSVLDYTINLIIPSFGTSIEANSLEYMINKLYNDMVVKGVSKW